MVAIRRMLAALALGSAFVALPAQAQHGSSVSLTHTVSVTVPPRVKVQVGSFAPMSQSSAVSLSRPSGSALSVSVSATQSWTLSIASARESSKLQWSSDRAGGFSDVGSRESTIASGEISQVPAASTLFFRNTSARGGADASNGGDVVMLTVVAP